MRVCVCARVCVCVCVCEQVIQLWFEEFALEDTHLCMADFVTLRDSLGIIGKEALVSHSSGKDEGDTKTFIYLAD